MLPMFKLDHGGNKAKKGEWEGIIKIIRKLTSSCLAISSFGPQFLLNFLK